MTYFSSGVKFEKSFVNYNDYHFGERNKIDRRLRFTIFLTKESLGNLGRQLKIGCFI